jgi:hypothetical protein
VTARPDAVAAISASARKARPATVTVTPLGVRVPFTVDQVATLH